MSSLRQPEAYTNSRDLDSDRQSSHLPKGKTLHVRVFRVRESPTDQGRNLRAVGLLRLLEARPPPARIARASQCAKEDREAAKPQHVVSPDAHIIGAIGEWQQAVRASKRQKS